MFDARRGGDPAHDHGYVETDPTRRYGRFDEMLGKGAMKTVYRAFDELNGREVAWNQAKLCDVLRSPEALQRLYSEVHLLSTLNHDSIIRFHASWIDVSNRTFNFITEMFTSGTLREYRQRYRRVDIKAVKNWAGQILHGLVYLHSHDPPVIHRDLKCDNIFVNGHLGQVKIGDLGLAAVLRRAQNAHSVIGTPEFMAPELYEEEYNELVDIYSFGMCVLEMITTEYPYSECSNPAQIYKKVTSGKLPDAFHRIQDPEAKRFIGRCLETVSKRSSAKELLSDPFLLTKDPRQPLPSSMGPILTEAKCLKEEEVLDENVPMKHMDMTITGKLNPEDDTIFLKVKIADKDGHVRNIYFPFDIVSDTPIDVANEMVKELEIADREPSEIAAVIAQEISILVPDWKKGERPPDHDSHHHVYNYGEDRDHPFYYMPSSPSASHLSDFGPAYQGDWLQDDLFSSNDDASSICSGKYSATNYLSCDDKHENPRSLLQSPALPESRNPRFQFEESTLDGGALAAKLRGQCNILPPESSQASTSRRKNKAADGRKLTRNQSMNDMRSQLLNRTMLEGLKRRLFKTVGAVENIGFQMPYDSRKSSPSSSPSRGDCKKPASIWGRR